jgi:hypothetical protein
MHTFGLPAESGGNLFPVGHDEPLTAAANGRYLLGVPPEWLLLFDGAAGRWW